MIQKNIKNFINEIYSKGPKKIMIQTKQTYTILTRFGV